MLNVRLTDRALIPTVHCYLDVYSQLRPCWSGDVQAGDVVAAAAVIVRGESGWQVLAR